MSLLHRIAAKVELKRRERGTVRALSRLGDRQLADFGLAREDIRGIARLAAREDAPEVPIELLVQRLAAETEGAGRRDVPALRRAAGLGRDLVDRTLDANVAAPWTRGLVP